MDVQHFNETVSHDGTVTLTGLPPDKKVQITVNPKTWEEEFREMQKSFQANHRFGKMSKEEILEELRITREKVWDERHGH